MAGRSIAIVAPYPGADRYLDGWMSRIKTIDIALSKHKRTYLDFQESYPVDRQPEVVFASDMAIAYRLNPNDVAHRHFAESVLCESAFVYIHTLHQCEYMLTLFDPNRMLVDIHGIVPEEELMMGSPERSQRYEAVERAILMGAKHVAVVTRAMRDHYLGKYPGTGVEFIHLPVCDYSAVRQHGAVLSAILAERSKKPNDLAIYAGGAQVWQCIDLMLDLISMGLNNCEYEIYSHDKRIFIDKLKRKGLPADIFKGYATRCHLEDIYRRANFGFVLRSENIVNRVASPTKICNYFAAYVIPVVRYQHIGDFMEYGYSYITYDDYLSGFTPDIETQAWMIENNVACLSAMRQDFRRGLARLSDLVGILRPWW